MQHSNATSGLELYCADNRFIFQCVYIIITERVYICHLRLSSNLSLATTESSNLISNAVVVWSLIAKALTLQGCIKREGGDSNRIFRHSWPIKTNYLNCIEMLYTLR